MRSSRRRSSLSAAISLGFALCCTSSAFAQVPAQSPQLAAAWTAAVRSLADKIVSDAGAPSALAMNMTNASSLGATDVSTLYDALVAALRARRFNIVSPEPPGGPDTRVQVTFSENVDSYIWVAEIWPGLNTEKGGERRIAIISAPKPAGAANGPHTTVTLSRKVIWAQAAKILDFGLMGPVGSTPDTLVILDTDRFAFYHFTGLQWQLNRAVQIAQNAAWPRDLRGTIDSAAGTVTLADAKCQGDIFHPDALLCEQMANQTNRTEGKESIQIATEDGAQEATPLPGPCPNDGAITLAAGGGDWTQPDELRAYEITNRGGGTGGDGAVRVMGRLDVPGPVLELGLTADGRSARIVSRNLQTGLYEASVVTISCGN